MRLYVGNAVQSSRLSGSLFNGPLQNANPFSLTSPHLLLSREVIARTKLWRHLLSTHLQIFKGQGHWLSFSLSSVGCKGVGEMMADRDWPWMECSQSKSFVFHSGKKMICSLATEGPFSHLTSHLVLRNMSELFIHIITLKWSLLLRICTLPC